MNVAIYARVSTHDKDQNPETQLRPLRQHLAGLEGVSVLGEFIDKAGADDLRGRREWRRLLDLRVLAASARKHPISVTSISATAQRSAQKRPLARVLRC